MKRKYLIATICLSLTTFGLTACGNTTKNVSQNTQTSIDMNIETPSQEENIVVSENSNTMEIEEFEDIDSEYTLSTEEESTTISSNQEIDDEILSSVFDRVKEELGNDYFPDTSIDSETLESLYGITPDMYESYYAEAPMISVNSDELLGFKTTEESKDSLIDALNSYMETQKSNTMQYPTNLAEIPAMQIVDNGMYVFLVATFGDVTEAEEQGDEAIFDKASKTVNKTISIINELTVGRNQSDVTISE